MYEGKKIAQENIENANVKWVFIRSQILRFLLLLELKGIAWDIALL